MKFLKDLPPKLKAIADYEILDSPVWRLCKKHEREMLSSAFIWAKTSLGYEFWKQVDDATPEQLLIIENSLK